MVTEVIQVWITTQPCSALNTYLVADTFREELCPSPRFGAEVLLFPVFILNSDFPIEGKPERDLRTST